MAPPRPWRILNEEALRSAPLAPEPFPYFVVDNLLRPDALPGVIGSFPSIPKRGSFPLESLEVSGAFATLAEELQSEAFRELIGERLGMDLHDKPPMLTLRGHTEAKDGEIHTDSKDKLVTVLVYLNPNWQAPGGRLRILYDDKHLSPYAAEIAPEAGRCLVFRVTPNCWHGHEPFVGERRSIQLNYVTSGEARERHLKRHRLSAFLKKLFSRQGEKRPSH